MPNWCEGTLKVRGTVDELKGFIKGGLVPVSTAKREEGPQIVIKDLNDRIGFEAWHDDGDITKAQTFWLSKSRRHFVEVDEIYLEAKSKEQKVILLLPFRAAWSINPENLRDLCVEYHVDMRITGFELGLQFQQEVEIVDGEILRDCCIKYDDYDWECPCPLLGG